MRHQITGVPSCTDSTSGLGFAAYHDLRARSSSGRAQYSNKFGVVLRERDHPLVVALVQSTSANASAGVKHAAADRDPSAVRHHLGVVPTEFVNQPMHTGGLN